MPFFRLPGGSGSPRTSAAAMDRLHIYSATWNIPEKFGGMTTAALRRIESFRRLGHPASQTLLTFAPRLDPAEVRERLGAQGRLHEDVDLVNIWHDLRARTDRRLAELGGDPVSEPVPAAVGDEEIVSDHYVIHRRPGSSKVIRRTYYRDDGSLLLVDVVSKGSRRFVLHDASGAPLAQFPRARGFYNSWIRTIVSADPAVLIIDDKRIGEFVHEIDSRTFGLVLFVHGAHLKHPSRGPYGEFLPQRLGTMRHLDRFDAVGVQSEQQKRAIEATGIDTGNVRFLSGELPASAVLSGRPPQRPRPHGVMVASLIRLKRVDHPIRAVAALRDRGIDVTLTILGKGPEREALEALVAELGLSDRVFLPGHVDDVPQRLLGSSFSVLTSTSEGLPLALMESMGAGCVPIVYDIAYGPQDLIDQGRNGYITPFGDIDALSVQIERFLALSDGQVSDMRAAAVQRVERYLPEAAFGRWKDVLEGLRRAQLPSTHSNRKSASAENLDARNSGAKNPGANTSTPTRLTVGDLRIVALGSRIQVVIEVDAEHPGATAGPRLVLVGRKVETFIESAHPEVRRKRFSGSVRLTYDFSAEQFVGLHGEIVDACLRRRGEMWEDRVRLRPPESFVPQAVHGWQWYPTKYGNLSVKPES